MILLSSSLSSGFPFPVEENDPREAIEAALRECRIARIRKDASGRTSPWIVTFSEGCAIERGIFRYVDRQRPQPMADSYTYDIAAYELTKILGVELIPPMVEREVGGRPGTLQVFLENCVRERDRRRKKLEPPDTQAFRNALEEIKVFVNLAYDDCYNTGDLYIHLDDWRVCRVDFTEAFAPLEELPPGCAITTCSKTLYTGLLALDEDDVRAKLGKYLNDGELGALFVRKNLILEKIKTLIAEKGEENVLF